MSSQRKLVLKSIKKYEKPYAVQGQLPTGAHSGIDTGRIANVWKSRAEAFYLNGPGSSDVEHSSKPLWPTDPKTKSKVVHTPAPSFEAQSAACFEALRSLSSGPAQETDSMDYENMTRYGACLEALGVVIHPDGEKESISDEVVFDKADLHEVSGQVLEWNPPFKQSANLKLRMFRR